METKDERYKTFLCEKAKTRIFFYKSLDYDTWRVRDSSSEQKDDFISRAIFPKIPWLKNPNFFWLGTPRFDLLRGIATVEDACDDLVVDALAAFVYGSDDKALQINAKVTTKRENCISDVEVPVPYCTW